uniref:Uncharacterized protein n=1 Tax=Glossina pallidipes TaxID=7398 RepID=A0A1A9ZAS5_GLOPL
MLNSTLSVNTDFYEGHSRKSGETQENDRNSSTSTSSAIHSRICTLFFVKIFDITLLLLFDKQRYRFSTGPAISPKVRSVDMCTMRDEEEDSIGGFETCLINITYQVFRFELLIKTTNH